MGALGTINSLPKRKRFLTRDTYNDFIEHTGSKLTYPEWRNSIKSFNTLWRETMLLSPFGYELPQGLGVIAVDKYQSDRDIVNVSASVKHNRPVKYLNLHTFGFRYKIKWYRDRVVNFKYHKLYKFTPARDMNRQLAAILFSGKDCYHKIKKAAIVESMQLKKYLDKKWDA